MWCFGPVQPFCFVCLRRHGLPMHHGPMQNVTIVFEPFGGPTVIMRPRPPPVSEWGMRLVKGMRLVNYAPNPPCEDAQCQEVGYCCHILAPPGHPRHADWCSPCGCVEG